MPLSDPFAIYVGGVELIGWTDATLSRAKQEMTGTLSVSVFRGEVPNQPILTAAKKGAPITAFIGGRVVFTGEVDRRAGGAKGSRGGDGKKTAGAGRARSIGSGHQVGGGGMNTSITPNAYIVTIRARGKTQHLMDSSHDHKSGTILNATTKKVIEAAVKSHKIQLEWIAPDLDMDKYRFQDGGIVDDEIQRVAHDYGFHTYETQDGKLRVTDGTSGTVGEPLIMGDNILEFSAEQGNENSNSQIKVKGQRSKKGVRGKDAVKRQKTVKPNNATGGKYKPLALQFYGDGTDEMLERRGKFEADKQNQEDNKCTIKVFHVQSRSGLPYDIGATHLVVVPSEGLIEEMECVALNHTVSHDKRIETTLTMAPLPGGGNGFGGMSEIVSMVTQGGGLAALGGSIGSLMSGKFPGLATIGGLDGMNALLSGIGQIAQGKLPISDVQALANQYRSSLGINYEPGKFPDKWSRTETDDGTDPEGEFDEPADNAEQVADGGEPLGATEGVE